MKIRLILVVLVIFGATHTIAKSIKVFNVKKCELQCTNYPWGNELHLAITGNAHKALNGARLTVTIYYYRYRIRSFQIYLKRSAKSTSRKINFAQQWGPLNLAAQEVLPGGYAVVVLFKPQMQDINIRKKWAPILKKNRILGYRKIVIHNKQKIDKNTQNLRLFYLQRMKNLNALYADLMNKKRAALQVAWDVSQGKNNLFAINGKFSARKWKTWFNKSFVAKITEEKRLLRRHLKQVFYPRFPVTRENMETYCRTLERLGRLTWVKIYKDYRLRQSSSNIQRIDPEAIKNSASIIQYIQNIHSLSAKELRIDLVKELGFLPPPGSY